MCKEVQVNGVLEVKLYACSPQVAKLDVVIYKDDEQALVIIKDYQLGQVDIYVNALVRNGRAGVGIYATPSKVQILKTVVSFNQANAYLTKLLAINKAANQLQDLLCMALN